MSYFIWCNHREEIERIAKQFHNALKYVMQILPRNVEDCEFWCSDIWIDDAELAINLNSDVMTYEPACIELVEWLPEAVSIPWTENYDAVIAKKIGGSDNYDAV